MSIRVTLDRVLLDRRMSLTELSERVGVTLANLSILKTGKAKAVRFSTLEAFAGNWIASQVICLSSTTRIRRTMNKSRPNR